MRTRIVAVTADLLARSGREAVTTRAVTAAAGVQAPTLYRLFGDKAGLLDAVAAHGFTAYLAQKQPPDGGVTPSTRCAPGGTCTSTSVWRTRRSTR